PAKRAGFASRSTDEKTHAPKHSAENPPREHKLPSSWRAPSLRPHSLQPCRYERRMCSHHTARPPSVSLHTRKFSAALLAGPLSSSRRRGPLHVPVVSDPVK